MGQRMFPNIMMANVLGYNGQALNILGRNADIDIASGFEDIWTPGGTKSWSQAAGTIEVLSDSANDDVGGSGAITIYIEGIGADYLPLTETITLNGVGVVAGSSNEYLNVWRASVVETGGSLVNEGTITVRYSGAGGTLCTIPVHASYGGTGVTQGTHYTIPANKFGLINHLHLGISGTAKSDVVLWSHLENPGFTPGASKKILAAFTALSGSRYFFYDLPLYVAPKTKIWFTANTDTNNTEVQISYGLAVVNL